jgi:hypothetical protein
MDPNYLSSLEGLFGAGGGGGNSSSQAVSSSFASPFYNQAGINFGSNPGGISTGGIDQSPSASVTPSRAQNIGINPIADNGNLFPIANVQNSSSIYLIAGFALSAILVVVMILKGKKK